jgi:ketosteroid isomerase-like protein
MSKNLLLPLFLLVSCTHPQPKEPMNIEQNQQQIGAVLDDWHDAAAKSDEARYFGHFTPDAVFLGTDATERWDVKAFREYAHKPFSEGRGWEMRAVKRNITIGGADVAWFDEELGTKNLGPARGSGVLRYQQGAWKIAQYNLTITVPNDRFKEVKTLLETAPNP